jgi:hypothetical protein
MKSLYRIAPLAFSLLLSGAVPAREQVEVVSEVVP